MIAPETSLGSADRSLVEQVYARLREQIIEGVFPSGTRLIERDLALSLDVSRVPLREAFVRLQLDGFIDLIPRRGAVVRQLTMRDADELFSVRISLEGLAAQLAAQRSSAEEIEQLKEALRQAEAATETDDPGVISSANAAFHECIVEISGNVLLQRMMAMISGRVRWLFRLTAERDPTSLCHEHQQLFAAIEKGDAESAAALASEHVRSGRRHSMEILSQVLPDEA